MPKVLRIINRFNIGGPTYNATFLTKFISEDYETLLVGGLPEKDESDSLHILEDYGVKPLLITEMKRIPNFRSDREAYRKIKQIIQEFQPDIVHTHAAKAGALGRKAAKKCGVPVIVHTFHGHVFHSYFGKTKTWLYKLIERRLAKISTGIIAISPLQKEELSLVHGICKAEKIKVIPLGFDLMKFRENLSEKRSETRKKWHLNDEEVAVAIVGRLAPIKNHSLFLDVIELLAQKGTKARYFIVGDGQEKSSVEQRAKKLEETYGLKIELTSWIKDIATFNAGMDIICLSSDNEGTPVSLIEAQASGVPVISTDVGGVKDILEEGKTGFVVPKKDREAFAEKLQLLIGNKEIRHKMSQNGWNFVRDKFHYTTLVKNMEDYYMELIEKTRKNAK
ncbi:MAG: glycosyl transferase group 1 [Fluviicola sp.]|jgi:glycosyltransferase involved in cell wall biosynthesis|uniref:glycosyltransferase n=1 Tax=Fluviicola sp. TaxID=1917219 RepID=UPI00261DB7FE|nr:glycosyltransferase [Fluviicola sp.]MDF3028718.1 glycosyl transferase group 1 [Fluviicola sp.]